MNNFQLSDLINLAKGDPQAMYDKMLKENPQFSDFVQKNKDKQPDEIAKEYNIDPAMLKLFIR